MKIKDYEKNLRKIELRSEKQKKPICISGGDIKKTYYDDGDVGIIERLLQGILNDLFIEGYLTNEIKASVCFEETLARGEILEINFSVLK